MTHFLLPLADVGSAFNGISGMLVSYLGAVLAFILIIAGYTYMFALDDHNKASSGQTSYRCRDCGSDSHSARDGSGTQNCHHYRALAEKRKG